MTENNELDMMRAQMHELKQDINRHNMINEKLMRQVMAYKSAWIRQYKSFELFCVLPFIYISFILIKSSSAPRGYSTPLQSLYAPYQCSQTYILSGSTTTTMPPCR